MELLNKFNDPVVVSIESTLFFKLSVVDATEELKIPIELDNEELNPNVVVATEEERLPIELDKVFVVVATLELKEPILELKSLVVVATLELRELILELSPLVVVAIDELKSLVVVATDEDKEFTLELKELTLELSPLVVVATEEDKEPILVDILELNVEYPVVPVNITWILPDITVSVLSLFLIVVLIDEVNVFKDPVEVSKDETLPSFDDV